MVQERINNHAALIWSVAELLRGDYKQSEYGKVVLPMTVIRRFDCVLEPTKGEVLKAVDELTAKGIRNLEPVLTAKTGQQFFNTHRLTMARLLDDPPNIADSLRAYIAGFSESARDVIDKFGFDPQISRLDRAGILYKVVARFADVDLHPDRVSNLEMGYLYEELIRRFSELSNETAGEHFTPREVIRLMVNLLFVEDDDLLRLPGKVTTLYDPACGTGGMLSVAEDYLRELNPNARLEVFGQELNDETYAICRSDMMLKGQDATNIIRGNSFTEDGHPDRKFDYMLANPPFGVDWGKYSDPIVGEHDKVGFDGRFGAGLPRKSDGSMLFLQHMISKMKDPEGGGSRIGIVFNASPLFTGSAGGGESEIRRWIIENDWLEAIIAMPEQMFYNTGIATYVWIVTNRKRPERVGKVQLIDARTFWTPMRKSLGDKRRQFSAEQIAQITRLYGEFTEGDHVKIFPNYHFGYIRITVERPLRVRWEINQETLQAVEALSDVQKLDPPTRDALLASLQSREGATATTRAEVERLIKAIPGVTLKPALVKKIIAGLAVRDEATDPILDSKGRPEPDTDLRDNENVPQPEVELRFDPDPTERLASEPYRKAVDEYVKEEVLPWVPDAWVDHDKTRIGYEIPFTREFFVYMPPRPLDEINADIERLEHEILGLLKGVQA
jgi:type I restriction enzyme M protein